MGREIWRCKLCRSHMTRNATEIKCAKCTEAYSIREELIFSQDVAKQGRLSLWAWFLPRFFETPLWIERRLKGASFNGNKVSYKELIARMTAPLPEGDTLLDLGAGPGAFGRRLAATWKSVYSVDPWAPMLEQGRRYARAERRDNMTFVVAPAECLPFSDAAFEATVFGGALHWCSDATLALSEVARTLRPGGILVGHTVARGGRSVTGKRLIERGCARSMFAPEELKARLTSAGFEDVHVETIDELVLFQGTRARPA